MSLLIFYVFYTFHWTWDILDYFQELRWPTHPHTTQMVRFKSSRSMSLQGCGNSCSEDGVSDVPLQYSNGEILVSLSVPLFLMVALGHFDDVVVYSQVEKASWGKVRVCFSCLLGFTWVRQNTTPLFQLASKMFVFNQCIWTLSVFEDVKQQCFSAGHG